MASGLVSLILKSLISRSGVNINTGSSDMTDLNSKFSEAVNSYGVDKPGFYVLGLRESEESQIVKLGLSDNWLDSIDKPFLGGDYFKYSVLITDGAGFVIVGILSKEDFEDNLKSESNESWLDKVASLYGVNIEHQIGMSEGKELYCDLTNRSHHKESFNPMFGETGALPYAFDITWPELEGYYVFRSVATTGDVSSTKGHVEFASISDKTAIFNFRAKPEISGTVRTILDIAGFDAKFCNITSSNGEFHFDQTWSTGTPADDVVFNSSNDVCSAAIGFVKEGQAYTSWWYSYYSDYAVEASEGSLKFQDAVGLTVQ